MMGNVWEWNETLIGSDRGIRSGSLNEGDVYNLGPSSRHYFDPYHENYNIGFCVVSIPEPTTLFLLGLGAVMLRRKR